MDQTWLRITHDMLATERAQAEQEGRDLATVLGEFDTLVSQEPLDETRAWALVDLVQTLPQKPGYPYVEPSDLESIKSLWAPGLKRAAPAAKELEERLHGAWLGRSCGCFLGKVCEGWRRDRMYGYLMDSGQWPLTDYISGKASEEVHKKHGTDPQWRSFKENVAIMPEDDDTNYTVTGLEIVRQFGRDFTPDNVAYFWLSNIPIMHVCTAERVAYKNFCNCIVPPESASYRNPFREWIGAQIRADFFGYCNPGDPYAAAEYGWRDAAISHVKNGIYGEMWSAAMNAAALSATSVREVLDAGYAVIPPKSRLTESLRRVDKWFAEGKTYDEVIESIHTEWDEKTAHGWCHTISNAMIVAVALLWGEMDFGKTICMAVQACFDTDCNGATAGSILGGLLGRGGIPAKWADQLNDTLETGVQGYHLVKISDMAKLTVDIIAK
jgi:hypothetical protein